MLKKMVIFMVAAFVVTADFPLLAKESNLAVVYAASGRRLESVHSSAMGAGLAIGKPLWLVVTEDEVLISSVDFRQVGGWKISRKVYGQAKASAGKDTLKIKLAPFSVELLELTVVPR